MYELEEWEKYEYPSYWRYVGWFSTKEEAIEEAQHQQLESWRIITIVAES